jgi:hypothetical protein
MNTLYKYYRVILNDKDKKDLNSMSQQIYQLKCIGAIPCEIMSKGPSLSSDNFIFVESLRPNSRFKSDGSIKPEFAVIFKFNEKENYRFVIKIEFTIDLKIIIRDINLYNTYTLFEKQKKYPLGGEYKLIYELETIFKNIFKLPKLSKLCSNCIHFPEYQRKGYCLKYHPDTKLS